jgi:hypothetical protein
MLFARYSELDRVDSEAARDEIMRAARRRVGLVRLWVGSLGVGLVFAWGCIFLLAEFGIWAKLGIFTTKAVEGMVVLCSLVVSSVATEGIWRRRSLVAVREILNERGIATCVYCGYDLRYIPSERCPECGVQRRAEPQADARENARTAPGSPEADGRDGAGPAGRGSRDESKTAGG